jgi:RHS repeat-associated protein
MGETCACAIAVTDPLGGVRRYEYGAFTPQGGDVTYHQLTKITDASGVVVTQVTYSGERVASYTEGANRFSYAYNTATKTVTKTDLLNSRWTFVYNDEGLITQETDPLGNRVTRVFDTNGRETSRTDQIGAVWTSTYDALGRTLSMTNPRGETTAFAYGGINRVPVRITSPSGRVTETTYDLRFNPLTVKDPAGQTTAMQWNSAGDMILSLDALGNQTFFTHNPFGLSITATDPLLRVSRWSYDALGRPVTVQNAAGEVTGTTYDLLDRMIGVSDPLGNTTSYSYDQVGRLNSVTDANNHTTTFAYDSFGRLVSTTSPDGRVRRTAYRADNLISQITLPDLRVIGYSYDPAKRLVGEDAAGEVTTFSYSGRSELVAASGPGGSVSFTYDAAGRVIQEISNGQTVRSTLNSEGERVALTALGSMTNYSRDVRGLITTIGTALGSVGLAYDALARRTELSFPNLAGTRYGYDADGQLILMNHAGPFSTTYGYTFDAPGRIVRQTGDGPDWQYTYDAAGRLISADHGTESFAYSYDGVGNIVADGQVHDSANRLTEDAGFVYTYDPNGNLIRKQSKTTGARTVYSWNAKNQLARVERFASAAATTPTKSLAFAYDPLDRRVSKTEDGVVERYVYDGADLIASMDGSGATTKSFSFGPGIDQPLLKRQLGSVEFFQANHVGSVIAATSTSGIVAEYHYDPYGDTTVSGDDSNPFRYTAREQDAADLYYYRARYYDPEIGRFISEDPLGLADGVNLYAYVGGSPVNLVDPLGLYSWDQFLYDAAQFSAGMGDNLSFGLTSRIRDWMGTNDVIDKCSGLYAAGEWTGVAVGVATGVAGGAKAAGTKMVGREFSHWIPRRMGGPRAIFNGNYVTPARHYLHDPLRYPPGWRALGDKWPAPLQQLDRIPNVFKGGAAGGAYGGASMAGNRCKCQ